MDFIWVVCYLMCLVNLKDKRGSMNIFACTCDPVKCSHTLFLQHQQFLALFNRIKFTRLLLTALITFTKREVIHTQTHSVR